VKEYKIFFFQFLEGSLGLALVVGVGESGGSGNDDDFQSGISSYAAYEVYGRYDTSAFDLRIKLHQCFHGRAVATAPRPDTVSRPFATGCFCLVERVLCQQLLAFYNQVVYQIGRLFGCHPPLFCRVVAPVPLFGFHEQGVPFFIRVVVWGGADNMLAGIFDDQ